MITELILNIFLAIPKLLLSFIPVVDFPIDPTWIEGLKFLFYGLGYVLPMGSIIAILSANFILDNAKVIWAILIRVKSFIPTMGS